MSSPRYINSRESKLSFASSAGVGSSQAKTNMKHDNRQTSTNTSNPLPPPPKKKKLINKDPITCGDVPIDSLTYFRLMLTTDV